MGKSEKLASVLKEFPLNTGFPDLPSAANALCFVILLVSHFWKVWIVTENVASWRDKLAISAHFCYPDHCYNLESKPIIQPNRLKEIFSLQISRTAMAIFLKKRIPQEEVLDSEN